MAELVQQSVTWVSEAVRQPFAVLKPSIPFPRFRPSIPSGGEAEILPICRELDWLLCPTVLGRGFLTGKIRSMDDLLKGTIGPAIRAFRESTAESGTVQQIEEMAAEKGSNLTASAGLGLGPGRRHSTDSGTKRTYLEENIAAAQITLSQAELDQIGLMLPPGIAAGTATQT